MNAYRKNEPEEHLVFTKKDLCRVCYTCVRECPVKAIRIINGQAEILTTRCIACGNCTRVCSQGAKSYLRTTDRVLQLLESSSRVAAIIAPSFPAAFDDIADDKQLTGMIRELGFAYVGEVAFGADLVAQAYKRLFKTSPALPYINSDCPAIVNYVRYYLPDQVHHLAPVVSPAMAMTRVVRQMLGQDTPVVFIGPCIAKKNESDEIDAVITFTELQEIFTRKNITPDKVIPSEFDPPHGGKGSIFPVSRGLTQNIDIPEQEKEGKIIFAEGKNDFRELLHEFELGHVSDVHLELLCCPGGCVMGPGIDKKGFRYSRQNKVKEYYLNKMRNFDLALWEENLKKYASIDLSRHFEPSDRRLNNPYEEQIKQVLQQMNKFSEEDMLNCGACGYDTCREHAIAIVQGLAESEMCLPYAIEQLHQSFDKLNHSNEELATAKAALKQSEKLASMGQLSAGIAHELNNPLGVITMYSHLLMEEFPDGHPRRKDIELIVEQAERCRKIVSGLLNFARKNQVRPSHTHIESFVQRSLDSVVIPGNVITRFSSTMKNPYAMIDQDQMMQVLTNIEKNAIEAMPSGGTLTVETSDTENEIIICISDTGVGIPKEHMEKIFTPFFTTKQVGKGTGLGMALVYGIVKMHKGKISITSNTDKKKGPTGTSVKIILPRNLT